MSGKMHSSCVGRGYIFLIMILPEISVQITQACSKNLMDMH